MHAISGVAEEARENRTMLLVGTKDKTVNDSDQNPSVHIQIHPSIRPGISSSNSFLTLIQPKQALHASARDAHFTPLAFLHLQVTYNQKTTFATGIIKQPKEVPKVR